MTQSLSTVGAAYPSPGTDHSHSTQIRFLADPALSFTNALDLSFDGKAIFGGDRSKRYALVIEDGKVKEAYIEPDNTGVKGRCHCRRLDKLNFDGVCKHNV